MDLRRTCGGAVPNLQRNCGLPLLLSAVTWPARRHPQSPRPGLPFVCGDLAFLMFVLNHAPLSVMYESIYGWVDL